MIVLATTLALVSAQCPGGVCPAPYRVERAYATAYVAPAHVYPVPQVQALAAAYVPPRAAYRERVKVRRRWLGKGRGCCR